MLPLCELTPAVCDVAFICELHVVPHSPNDDDGHLIKETRAWKGTLLPRRCKRFRVHHARLQQHVFILHRAVHEGQGEEPAS